MKLVKFREGFYADRDSIIAIHRVDVPVDGKEGCKVILRTGEGNYVLTLDISPNEAASRTGYSWWRA